MISEKLLKLLIQKKIFTENDWNGLQAEAKKINIDVEDLLVRKNLISEKDITKIKGELYGLPFADLEKMDISSDIVNTIPQASAENYNLVVFNKKDKDVDVAMENPGNYRAIEAINFWAKKEGYKIKFFITTGTGLRNVLKNYTEFKAEVSQAVEQLEEKKAKEVVERKPAKLVEVIKRAPVSKIVTLLIQEAVDLRASDIHIEPGYNETRVRFRIDGILRSYLRLPMNFHASITSRIKVLSSLKIDETRIPQDGRIRMDVYGQDINLRISTLPVQGGEKIVMRILPTTTKVISLEDLGFWCKALENLNKVIERPTGVMLVSGPTGSGKSTTLFSILGSLNKETVNIATLEDPVEYFIEGVNQVQINPDVGLTFASGLRALLRQDPNIVMVGEIRDFETAELAIHAALTGHFLLSTIHAKDVLGVIPRLTDMHVEPFLISAALNIITAQRLVRKVCDGCKKEAAIPQRLEDEMKTEIEAIPDKSFFKGVPMEGKLKFYKGEGCEKCGGIGYKGRMVVSEVLSMTPQLQDILGRKYSLEDLSKEMKRQGEITFKQDALLKALMGRTSVEEILRATRE